MEEAIKLIEAYEETYEKLKSQVEDIQEQKVQLLKDNKIAYNMLIGFGEGSGKNTHLIKKPQELALKTKQKLEELQEIEKDLLNQMIDIDNMLKFSRATLEYRGEYEESSEVA
jgi:hypothetical protein